MAAYDGRPLTRQATRDRRTNPEMSPPPRRGGAWKPPGSRAHDERAPHAERQEQVPPPRKDPRHEPGMAATGHPEAAGSARAGEALEEAGGEG
jgi:hypothetical protein